MARVGTAGLNLGMYLDEEDPGAGSQVEDSTGLNGNWWKIDTSITPGHNADGSHKANVIKGSNLVQTGGDSCVDGTTLEFSANKIQVKALGIGSGHLATGAVTAGKIANDGISATAQLANAIVTGAKLASTTVALANMANDSVDATKITHDNNRTKNCFTVIFDSSAVNTYAKIHGLAMAATLGLALPRAGRLTKMTVASAGSVGNWTPSYASAPTFAANDRVYFKIQTWSTDQYVAVYNITAAAELTAGYEAAQPVVTAVASIIVTMEVEFDD